MEPQTDVTKQKQQIPAHLKGHASLLLDVESLEDGQDWGDYTGTPAEGKKALKRAGILCIGQVLAHSKDELEEKLVNVSGEGASVMFTAYVEHAIKNMFKVSLDKYVDMPDFSNPDDFLSMIEIEAGFADMPAGTKREKAIREAKEAALLDLIQRHIKDEFEFPVATLTKVFIDTNEDGKKVCKLEVELRDVVGKNLDDLKKSEVFSKFGDVIGHGFNDLLSEDPNAEPIETCDNNESIENNGGM